MYLADVVFPILLTVCWSGMSLFALKDRERFLSVIAALVALFFLACTVESARDYTSSVDKLINLHVTYSMQDNVSCLGACHSDSKKLINLINDNATIKYISKDLK